MLIKVYNCAVSSGDVRIRSLNVPFGFGIFCKMMFGFSKPNKVLGGDFSGEIIEIGENVTHYKVGDFVFGSSDPNFGSNAEYMVLPETGAFTIKPENLSFKEAGCFTFSALNAMYFLKEIGKI